MSGCIVEQVEAQALVKKEDIFQIRRPTDVFLPMDQLILSILPNSY